MKHDDSPRWCAHCNAYGDHHTDRCPELDRFGLPRDEWRDPGDPEQGADKWDLLIFAVIAVLAVALAIWLVTS